MRSRFFMLAICFFYGVVANAINNPYSVSKFYAGLKSLENATSTNDANLAQQNMASCFMASDQSGINLSMDGLGEMSSSLYTMKLFMMIYSQKSLKIENYNITRTEIVEQPDQNSSMQKKGAQHYVTYVTKLYLQDGKRTTYNDMVFTLISNGLIVEMENSESSGFIPPTTRPSSELNIEQIRARAAYYYSIGKYRESYGYYEQLIQKSPTDGDAAYRIALMTFWRKGCKDRFSKKTAEEKAKEYLEIALNYGSYEIKNKAANVSANWEHNNVYF